jgi:hypothetical protein
MPTDIATYIVAQRVGLRLDKYLDRETIESVNGFLRHLEEKESRGSSPAAPASRVRQPKVSGSAVKQITFERLKVPPGSLSTKHVTDAEKMAGTSYPVLYVFENSVREFIDGHLTAAYGKDWFNDDKLVSKGVRQTVDRNRHAEATARYHSQRNARSVYYTNLDHLSSIVRSERGWKVFKSLFPRDTWFPELVSRFEVSRNVVAHMNPLNKTDIRRLEDGLVEWLKQIQGQAPGS